MPSSHSDACKHPEDKRVKREVQIHRMIQEGNRSYFERRRLMEYIIGGVEEWNKKIYLEQSKKLPGKWYLASSSQELQELLDHVNPKFIFFIHWRWIVDESVVNNYNCVCFHMTDVPYGRGGSPLQNLIVQGHKDTVLTALKMEPTLDTGPVYMKKKLSLDGRAEDIYIRATYLSWEIIKEMIHTDIKPTPQQGETVVFKRRTPDQSELPGNLPIEKVYDHIRMLDAPNYPHAYLEHNGYKIEFKNATLSCGKLFVQAEIKIKEY